MSDKCYTTPGWLTSGNASPKREKHDHDSWVSRTWPTVLWHLRGWGFRALRTGCMTMFDQGGWLENDRTMPLSRPLRSVTNCPSTMSGGKHGSEWICTGSLPLYTGLGPSTWLKQGPVMQARLTFYTIRCNFIPSVTSILFSPLLTIYKFWLFDYLMRILYYCLKFTVKFYFKSYWFQAVL